MDIDYRCPRILRSLEQFSRDTQVVRCKRRLTVVALCERSCGSQALYNRVIHGSLAVSAGVHAMHSVCAGPVNSPR
jgi:hypothetical protein